jgi:hypothetical protein
VKSYGRIAGAPYRNAAATRGKDPSYRGGPKSRRNTGMIWGLGEDPSPQSFIRPAGSASSQGILQIPSLVRPRTRWAVKPPPPIVVVVVSRAVVVVSRRVELVVVLLLEPELHGHCSVSGWPTAFWRQNSASVAEIGSSPLGAQMH